ncbi:uncharacterized protein LOC126484247 [Schistocerca serialis cubense]|uniref:uncharacterized protein LOC126484247 n=1 Tax=Schistocerca serialis cubense TaxID=2023355 RepID=UPI00214F6017|nr:uncharacterized protein LOC126484247 [Schistocerca serialis cubense]
MVFFPAVSRPSMQRSTSDHWMMATAGWVFTLLAIVADLPWCGESAAVNLTLPKVPSVPLSMDDDSPYLQDLYWPHNDSWPIDTLDEFERNRLRGVFLAEPQTTPVTVARPPPDPEFDPETSTNVSARLGATASLHCRVRNLGEHSVSWVRKRDWHILTSGLFTYTNDDRFQASHSNNGEDWSLHIKYVQKRDNGTYECQVATGKGTITQYFHLHIIYPTAFILGNGEYHIGEGSTISLVCIIEYSQTPPQQVVWSHNGRPLSRDGARGVALSTEPGPRTHSRLVVARAARADAGNYTCGAPGTEPDTISVYVSEGDNTAAIQRQEASRARRLHPHLAAGGHDLSLALFAVACSLYC